VAVKVLRNRAPSAKATSTYVQEVQLLQSFSHAHVLRFVGVCCEVRHLCIVTEYLARGSLYDVLHPKWHSAPLARHTPPASPTRLRCAPWHRAPQQPRRPR
jgi:serine/threonine protein kinase